MQAHPKTCRDRGFTFVEVLMVVTILGILAAISLNTYFTHQTKARDEVALSSTKNAFNTAQGYFAENPENDVSLELLKAHGFVQSPGVNVTCSGDMASLNICVFHEMGSKTFYVDHRGVFTSD